MKRGMIQYIYQRTGRGSFLHLYSFRRKLPSCVFRESFRPKFSRLGFFLTQRLYKYYDNSHNQILSGGGWGLETTKNDNHGIYHKLEVPLVAFLLFPA